MISEKTARRIQELKAEGHTQVWIARELQVSRVAPIASLSGCRQAQERSEVVPAAI